MKKLFLFLLLILSGRAYAQMEILESAAPKVTSVINLIQEGITPGIVEGATAKISQLQLSIEKGDVVLSYQLPVLEDDQFYEVMPQIKLDGKALIIAPDEYRGDLGRTVAPGSRRIIWLNPLERYVNLTGQLEVQLLVNIWGERQKPYDCSLGSPTFTAKQRLPYLVAAGVGVASVGVGQLFRKQKETTYDDYINADTKTASDPIYLDANSKNHTYLILTWTGTAILAADAVLYLIRQKRYKRNLNYYETYCKSGSTSFQPLIELPNGNQHRSGQLGFKMVIPISGQ
ncbi:MAG: hypothetical protein R2824_23330 [Saprospiraceae bacterium]|nr:hypothetical protein [Lewinella sp.]